jgi:hypothetical protein
MVIIPGRGGIDHLISRIHNGPEQGIDKGTASAGYQNFPGRIIQSLPVSGKIGNGFPQVQVALSSRIIGEMIAVGLDDLLFQNRRNGKYLRIEIPDSKIEYFVSLSYFFPDLASQADDLRSDQRL